MAFSDPIRIRAQVYQLLGRPEFQVLPPRDIEAARIAAGMEILRAIVVAGSSNGHFSALQVLVPVVHNSFLPDHDGEPGIPRIVPFLDAPAREGQPADPDDIDAWRTSPESYTGMTSGVTHAHNAAIAGKKSPLSCRYSMINGYFKFTGYSAEVPLVQLTRQMADTGVPENYEPTVVKLTAGRFPLINDVAKVLIQLGRDDLVSIQEGAMMTKPPRAIAEIATAQKQFI